MRNSRRAPGGPDAPYLLLAFRHATLADYESARPTVQAGRDDFTLKTAPLARQQPLTTLLERLQTTNPGGATRWQQTNVLAPAVGKSAALRAYLLEDGERVRAEGRRSSLLVQMAGPESGVFTRIFQYDRLADLEAARARVPLAEGAAARAERRDALLSRPISIGIREVLVPYPDR